MIVCICANINEEEARKILAGKDCARIPPYGMNTACARCSSTWNKLIKEYLETNRYEPKVP